MTVDCVCSKSHFIFQAEEYLGACTSLSTELLGRAGVRHGALHWKDGKMGNSANGCVLVNFLQVWGTFLTPQHSLPPLTSTQCTCEAAPGAAQIPVTNSTQVNEGSHGSLENCIKSILDGSAGKSPISSIKQQFFLKWSKLSCIPQHIS